MKIQISTFVNVINDFCIMINIMKKNIQKCNHNFAYIFDFAATWNLKSYVDDSR